MFVAVCFQKIMDNWVGADLCVEGRSLDTILIAFESLGNHPPKPTLSFYPSRNGKRGAPRVFPTKEGKLSRGRQCSPRRAKDYFAILLNASVNADPRKFTPIILRFPSIK